MQTNPLTGREKVEPVDNEGNSLRSLQIPRVSLARTVDATISASTEITLNAATTFIRVYAIDKDVYMKWGTADVTAANFDEVIPANQICDFYVPTETSALYTAVNFIERAATGGIIVIEK